MFLGTFCQAICVDLSNFEIYELGVKKAGYLDTRKTRPSR